MNTSGSTIAAIGDAPSTSRGDWIRRALILGIGFPLVLSGYLAISPRLSEATFWYGDPSVPAIINHFMETEHVPGAVIAYGHAGEQPTVLTFGISDPSTETPVQASDTFQIASISKMITNEAILTLVDRGKLGLDTTLASIIPEVGKAEDPRYREITIRHLMQHTSGLGWQEHYDLVKRDRVSFAKADACYPTLIERLKQPLDSDPGDKAEYSDFGPCWLALIIAKVSGQPYEKFVQDSVLQPMGVTMHTITDAPQSAVQDYADGTEEDRIQFNPSAGWISTASDLYRFANRPIRGVEISDLVPGEFDNQFFGLGWWIWRTPSEFIEYTHTGHLDGARAIMAVTSDGIVMAALFNGAEVPRSLERFAVIEHGLIAAIRKDAAVEKKALELKEERLRHIPKWCRDDWTRCRTRI